ncbi:MAG: TrkH family potassium uptake protein [Planctomycetes bacterium]|nr:TrkH family potassium uptake protein [Planctomycetota bacterium]
MNFRIVGRLLAGFTLFFTLAMLAPLAMSLFEDVEQSTTVSFLASIGVGFAVAAALWALGRNSGDNIFRKEGLAMVGLAWFLAGVIAAVPFVCSDSIPSFVDAYFECISGLTTTGATVLGTANRDIDTLAPSMLLWRAMLQWMGGIGIVLVFIVLLPSVGVTGSRLLSSEQVGLSEETSRPRMSQQARRLFQLYLGLTVAATLSYWLAGLPLFEALCHSMTTLATGGFSNHNVSVGGYRNLAVECIAIVFMFVAGCNFLLILRTMLRRPGTSQESSLHGSEFRFYLWTTLGASLFVALTLWLWGEPMPDASLGTVHDYGDPLRCLRDGTFQVVSILTTTGYANANFQNWPAAATYTLFLCMLVGGCTGSTAGGFKILRAAICAKLGGYTLRHFVRPRSVEKLRVGADVLPDRVVSAVVGLLVLWFVTVAAGALVIGLDSRVDLVSAVAASTSMMGCVGPAFGEVVARGAEGFELVGSLDLGPYAGYGELHWWAKLTMAVQMVLGRLEILAPLAILTPRFWWR